MRHFELWFSVPSFQPELSPSKLQDAVDTFNLSGDIFLEQLQPKAESGETILLLDFLHRATLDVIMRVSGAI